MKSHLEQAARAIQARKSDGNFRLSIDRCFTINGVGLIVTGTAMSGGVAVGDEVRALLTDLRARVRSIHAHNTPAAHGGAGQRLALNIASVEGKFRIARGDWLVAGDVPPATLRLDACLRVVDSKALAHWTPVHVHVGAAHVTGRVAVLEGNSIPPGNTSMVQLVLEDPIGAVHGDRLIVRDQSSRRTLGGGTVIDVFSPVRGRARPERLAHLAAMSLEDDATALDGLLAQAASGVDLARFAANRNLRDKDLFARVPMRIAGSRGFSHAHWSALRNHALSTIAAWHARLPDSAGPPEDRIVEDMRLPRQTVLALAHELASEGAIVREALGVRLSAHRVQLSGADAALWKQIASVLEKDYLRPPTIAELAAATATDIKRLDAALSRAARQGLVVRVSKNRFFLPVMLERLKELAKAEAQTDGTITTVGFRDRSGIGRNVTIEVLEYFDRIKFTRRIGDSRVLIDAAHGRDSHPGGAHGLQIR